MWRRAVIGAILLFTGWVCFERWNAPRPEESYARALALLRNGDFAGAARPASRGVSSDAWMPRFRLLEAEALMESGQIDRARTLLEDDSGSSPEFRIRARAIRARHALSKAAFADAEKLLRESSDLAKRSGRADLQPEIDVLLGQWFGRQERYAEGEEVSFRAQRMAIAAGDLFRHGSAVNNLGMLRMVRSRCDEAIPLFEEARHLWKNAGAGYWVAAADNNLGMCHSQLGDFDRALGYREEASKLTRPSALLARILGESGTLHLNQREPRKAIPYYRQAMDISIRYGQQTDAARWAGNLASSLVGIGDWNSAESALADALRLGPEPRSRAFMDLSAADIALGRGKLQEARETYERIVVSAPGNTSVLWPAYAGIAQTRVLENDLAKADEAFGKAIQIIADSQSMLARADHKITFLARLIRFYQDYVDFLIAQNSPARALEVVDGSRARLMAERSSRPAPPGLPMAPDNFQSIARRSGSVWLSYWIAPRRSFLWVATSTELRVLVLPPQAEIAALVDQYRGFIELSMRDPMQAESDAGRRLYEILIAPAAAMIPRGASVMIVPDGPLHHLSFDSLPVYGSARPHYWIEDAVVSIAPSFALFREDRGQAGAVRKGLIVGDPIAVSPEFPRLPHAAREIESVARHLDSPATKVITGAEARPDIWRTADPGAYPVIHIAAHAQANFASPLDSALILSRGSSHRLLARDVIDVPLRAELVTLSACRSSGARSYAGEGLVGLAWAFLLAGAESVIGGLWDVADESTALLMDRLYASLASGAKPAKALREARLSLLETPYAKPYYWAPFQCYVR